MEISASTTILATPSQVFAFMTSPEFPDAMLQALDAVSAIEETSRSEVDGELRRVLRYTAPTAAKIPKFLKKYAAKAPEFAHWEERSTWDTTTHTLRYNIVPEVPDSWHDRYENQGTLRLTEDGPGRTRMDVTLTFGVNVFGFKKLIERSLRPEIEEILAIQGKVISEHAYL